MKDVLNIGIMGGTFDPVHIGHIEVAKSVAEQVELDRVLFVPTGTPNFKQDQYVTPAEHRLAMVELAIQDEPLFRSDACEIERGGITYTADTLEELQERYPNARLFFIMGTDAAITLPQWRRAEDVARMCTIVVAQRPGQSINELRKVLSASPIEFHVICLDVPQLDISSTDLRDYIAAGLPVDDMIHPEVLEYIRANKLYCE